MTREGAAELADDWSKIKNWSRLQFIVIYIG